MNNSSNSFDRYANLKRNFAPYHKSEGAGQIVNHDEGHKHLSDYIRSVRRAEAFDAVAAEKNPVSEATTKLTFEEWSRTCDINGLPLALHKLSDYEWELASDIWKAAQENK